MAQVTRAAFAASLASLIPDNTSGDVTPEDIRSIITDLEDSAVWYDEVGTAAASDTGDFATASHAHTLADISDAGTAAASATGDFAAASHNHAATEITSGDLPIARLGELVSGDANNTLSAAPKFWVGTQANYDALTPDAGTIYWITD